VQGSYEASEQRSVQPLIVLDPGHGGSDEGAKINTFMEKKLTLVTTGLVRQHLEARGYQVLMTRSKDVYLPLPRRVSIANKRKGAIFVSIHFNSAPRADVQGIEVFYFDSKEAWRTKASRRLASNILRSTLEETSAASRGIKQGNFHVIRETDMPAVLVEGGFMTNKEERARLRDRDYLNQLARGIAEGIDLYMRR
jgi:N-acetylmuramoyl-L-alanine amidase